MRPYTTTVTRFCLAIGMTISMVLSQLGCSQGCSGNTIGRFDKGLIIILPGIEGAASPFPGSICAGLRDADIDCAIEIFSWDIIPWLGAPINLMDLQRNKRQARKLARRIVIYQNTFPQRPVHLIGHSGGAGIGLLALKAMPPARKVDSLTLLAPAVAPDYDLAPALKRIRYSVYNYYSTRDVGFLRLGTTIFGTADRKHTVAAGAVGFNMPPLDRQADKALYEKLIQVKWTPRLAKLGAYGGHVDWAGRKFVRNCIAKNIKMMIRRRKGGYNLSGN